MRVIKRNGEEENVSFDKVINRVKSLSMDLDIDPMIIAQKVVSQISDKIKTSELDEFASQIANSMSTMNPDYGKLALRISVSNNHKGTKGKFSEAMRILYENVDHHSVHQPIISKKVWDIIQKNKRKIDQNIVHNRDYDFDYFGFKTLERSYLLKVNGEIVERIQYLFMRVSLGLHGDDLDAVFNSYNAMSQKKFIHATPTLFNAGTPQNQLLSCYLLGTEDSIQGIYKTISDCAMISKWAGGIGVHTGNIRSSNALIRGTNGKSSGIMPMLQVYNATAKYVNQGGKRKGSIAIYMEMHHPDIMAFLDLRKNHGNEDERCRDLFTACWISDLFMERVRDDGDWCLFDPDEAPGLEEAYGNEYRELYLKYEKEGKQRQTMKAQKIWRGILSSQIETGTPYVLYKDNINNKSNHKHLGTIRSSNLCAEIVEYSDHQEYACCCLSSIGLPTFVKNPEMGKLTVFGRDGCGFCDKAKRLLKFNDIEYEYILVNNIDERQKLYYKLKETTGKVWNTFPMIFDGNGVFLGGFSDLKEKMRPYFDYDDLIRTCETIVRNLNKIVDHNFYPVEETRLSNLRHRPLGVGVQGFADMVLKMGYNFDSEETRELNRRVFEAIQYGTHRASMLLSKERHKFMEENEKQLEKLLKKVVKNREKDTLQITYENHIFTASELEAFFLGAKYPGSYLGFAKSEMAKGRFQHNFWGVNEGELEFDWVGLRKDIMEWGIRNSMLTALMPTASTSQILGNNECFEPYTSNIYTRRTLAGDFVVLNKFLVNDLEMEDLWNVSVKDEIIAQNGSIQDMMLLPDEIKDKYKTAWELKQKVLIDLSAERGPFIDQTQSLNLFFEEPTFPKLGGALMYGWQRGLKTGSYYIRSRPKVQAQQFTIDPRMLVKRKNGIQSDGSPTMKAQPQINEENSYGVCESCSG